LTTHCRQPGVNTVKSHDIYSTTTTTATGRRHTLKHKENATNRSLLTALRLDVKFVQNGVLFNLNSAQRVALL
jgi:hypothetical protein